MDKELKEKVHHKKTMNPHIRYIYQLSSSIIC